mmetsp:Transcript_10113/g.23445  ORF Transcript_10113/g.23445 Transcript_10113/m.23445 type:complete len:126 (+) Transcript_10113:83-460(+)
MGNGPRSRKNGAASKNKGYRKYFLSTKHRTKDVDQVQDEIKKGGLKFDYDEDLPGGGQFYCVETARHFVNAEALALHKKSKEYKRRLKRLKEEQYTQAEAEMAAGMTKEVLPPAHPPAAASSSST